MVTLNQASQELVASQNGRLTWPNVLAAIQETKTRETVLAQFRSGGFDADSWRLQSAKSHMAHCLTTAEDMLEGMAGSKASQSRFRVSAVRRRLELELWP